MIDNSTRKVATLAAAGLISKTYLYWSLHQIIHGQSIFPDLGNVFRWE
jgi:hypothetical protein